MRPSYGSLALTLLASPALAGPLGGKGSSGGGSSGGPLSQVSSGIGAATGSGGNATGYKSPTGNDDHRFTERECFTREHVPIDCTPENEVKDGVVIREVLNNGKVASPGAASNATADFYLGAQKVHDSNGSVSLEVIVRERRFRVTGALSHYFETLPDGGRLTMSMPSITAGMRVDDLGPTSVVIEAGVVHALTKGDPMENSSITGPLAGMRVEHQMQRNLSVLADAQALWFPDDIRARAFRVGLRYGHFQGSIRALDFNVGPILFGPEVGMRF